MSNDPRKEAVNITGEPYEFDLDTAPGSLPTHHKVAPGDTVLLSPGYCQEIVLGPDRDPMKSIIERHTNGSVVPVDSEAGRKFLASQSRKAEAAARRVRAPEPEEGPEEDLEEELSDDGEVSEPEPELGTDPSDDADADESADPGDPGAAGFDDMNVAQLRDHAESLGLELPARMKRDDIIAAIEGAVE